MLTARQDGNRVVITFQVEARSMGEIVDMAAQMMAGMTDADRLRVLRREAEIRAEKATVEGGGAAVPRDSR